MAAVDFQLFDNGQAVATLSVLDAAGLPTVLPAGTPPPTWTSSNPGVLVSASADGLSAIVSPATPPVLVTGAVLTASTTLAGATSPITGTSDPIDVAGSGAAGFKIALATK
jgi:hypothetical protein